MWPQIRPLPCHPWLPVKPEVAAKLPPGLLHPPLPSVFGSPWTLASVFGRELFKGEGEEEGFMEKKKQKNKTTKKKREGEGEESFCSHTGNSNSTPACRQRRLLHAARRIKCFCFIFNTQSLLVLSCRSSPLPPTCIRFQWHPCQQN